MNGKRIVETQIMLDSGAGENFIDHGYARDLNLTLNEIDKPLIVNNVDRTKNKTGTIKYWTNIRVTLGERMETIKFYITGLGRQKMILGITWHQQANPNINYQNNTITWRTGSEEKTSDYRILLNSIMTKPESKKKKTKEMPDLVDLYDLDPDNELFEIDISEISIDDKGDIQLTPKTESLKKPLNEMIPKEYHDFLDVFDEEKASRFPTSKVWDHKIELKEGFIPKSGKIYNLSPQEQLETKKFLKENLNKGYIRPSSSPQAAPLFFVKKKTGGLRPCQDYRYLNEWTIKNAYPLPLITDILDKLKGAKYFTKLDVQWGYNNVRIRDGDQWKAAFKTPEGLFEPTVMFFGMTNSPATFQSMMDEIFRIEIDKGCVIIYMDDILIFAKTQEELELMTRQVLLKLRENDLFLKPEKCAFAQTQVEYLGFIIEEGKVSMDQNKIEALKAWPEPKNQTEVRQFIGFGNFYRKFIRGYSDLARPLNELLKKERYFEWTQEAQEAFDTLKDQFSREPVLFMPDMTRPFQIKTDASKYPSGGVLTQEDKNGNRHPIAFISKSFTDTERNYDIYDRELYAIIRALKEWRHYIQGSPFTTRIYTDHQNLIYFKGTQNLNR